MTTGVLDDDYAGGPYADTYFGGRGVVAWQGVDRLAALVRATDYVKALFAPYFDPAKFLPGASYWLLQRVRGEISSGKLSTLDALDAAGAVIPDVLVRAVCQYALVEVVTPGGLAPVPQVDGSGYSVVQTSRKIGPIQRTFAVVGKSTKPPSRRLFPLADGLIAQVLLPATNVVIR